MDKADDGLCGLYLTIGKGTYKVERTGLQSFRLTQAFDLVYDVHRDKWGVHCTCADYTYRRQNTPHMCKHGKALVEKGLL